MQVIKKLCDMHTFGLGEYQTCCCILDQCSAFHRCSHILVNDFTWLCKLPQLCSAVWFWLSIKRNLHRTKTGFLSWVPYYRHYITLSRPPTVRTILHYASQTFLYKQTFQLGVITRELSSQNKFSAVRVQESFCLSFALSFGSTWLVIHDTWLHYAQQSLFRTWLASAVSVPESFGFSFSN